MAAEPPTLRADARRNRERIVAAAAELFAAQGLESQMAEVAKRAGVGNATVFRHFATKHDLLVAVLESQFAEVVAYAETSAAHPDPAAGLRELVDRLGATMVANQALRDMVETQIAGDPRIRALRDRLLERLTSVLARCQAAGAVRDDVEAVDVVVLVLGVAVAVAGLVGARPGLHRRYLALALAGLSPGAADGPLPMRPPTPAELDAAWKRSDGPSAR